MPNNVKSAATEYQSRGFDILKRTAQTETSAQNIQKTPSKRLKSVNEKPHMIIGYFIISPPATA